jgi:hypothetical protein
MEMKLKIIETPDYILAVSDKIEEGDYILTTKTSNIYKADSLEYLESHNMIEDFDKSYYINSKYSKKIIACLPKNNTPQLDLPLLPEMVVEEDVEKLAKIATSKLVYSGPTASRSAECFIWIKGYKAATKVYSEEDLRKAFEAGNKRGWSGYPDTDNGTQPKFEEFIQSLKQHQTPKWFVAEKEYLSNTGEWKPVLLPSEWEIDTQVRLKTTTINGKTYLVGTYLNELN